MNRLLNLINPAAFIAIVLLIISCGNGMDVITRDKLNEDTAPSSVSISSVIPGDREVTISWTDPMEAGFDHVKINWVPGGTSASTVTEGIENYTASGLSNDTDYVFTLVSVSSSGKESPPVSLTSCPFDNEAPEAVSINDWDFSEPDAIIVNWSDPADSDFHHVKVTWSPGGAAGVTVPNGSGTYSAAGLSIYDTDYSFTLVGVDDDGNQSLPVTVNMPHKDIVPPGLVSLLTSASAPGEITLNWTDPVDTDFDHVLVSWAPGGSTPQTATAGTETFTATGMSIYDTDYTFSVISVDSDGNQSTPATINVPHIDIVPPGEVVMDDTDSTSNTVTLNWTDPGDADLDHITVSWIPDSGSQNVAAGTETSIVTGLSWGTDYTITVVAVDAAGNESGPVSITVSPTNGPNYLIYTAEDLNAVRGGVPGYADWGLDGHYNIMTDIDLSGYASWIPIGNDSGTPFIGTLDGNGHTITGLTIDAAGENSQGLFGAISDLGCAIKNLNIDGFTITGNQQVGALAGRANYSSIISNCHVRGNITGGLFVGGVVGTMTNSASISNSSAQVNITTGTGVAGGLAGLLSVGTIDNSHAIGTITGGANVGGLLGAITSSGSVTNTYASVAVSSTSTPIGGFIGLNSSGAGTFTGCYYDKLAVPTDNGLGGTNVTTPDMKVITTFTGWDFADVWGMDPLINSGYPYLRSNPLY